MATEHPTSLDIAWAAGIFEGEGHCRSTGRAIWVRVAQKDGWLPVRLKALFGGSVQSYRASTGIHYFHWNATGARARGFAMTIYKFLSPRRQQQIRRALGVEERAEAAAT